MVYRFQILIKVVGLFVIFIGFQCTAPKNENISDIPNLVPNSAGTAPNYWCTWYWQNYLINKGMAINSLDGESIFSNPDARDELNQESIFGEYGMAQIMLPRTREDYYFLIDHGWQDKLIKENTFFTLVMDTLDFPRYSKLGPKDRLKQMNEDIKSLGWRGLGIWVRGNISEDEAIKFVEWSKHAGIEYWKIDGGETENFYCYKAKEEIYPQLSLEYVTGSGGPLNPYWETEGLISYPSVYKPGTEHIKDTHAGPGKASKALEVITKSDVFRTYDAVPLLVSTVTLQRVHDLLQQTAGDDKYVAQLNIQDDCNIAAALGLVVAVKRHPMKTPRLYKGRDIHFQIAGDRHVDRRFNEMDRLAKWQKLAPPMPAGYGSYKASKEFLIDKYKFRKGDTWEQDTWGKIVTQSAPAIMARNIPLPEVEITGDTPYVLAGKFPNGAIGITTEGRVSPDNSWFHPRAKVNVQCGDSQGKPIGIFGHYKSLTLIFDNIISKNAEIWAQDLLAEHASDITSQVEIKGDRLIISGELIDKIGTEAGDEGDISVPGLVLQIL